MKKICVEISGDTLRVLDQIIHKENQLYQSFEWDKEKFVEYLIWKYAEDTK